MVKNTKHKIKCRIYCLVLRLVNQSLQYINYSFFSTSAKQLFVNNHNVMHSAISQIKYGILNSFYKIILYKPNECRNVVRLYSLADFLLWFLWQKRVLLPFVHLQSGDKGALNVQCILPSTSIKWNSEQLKKVE